MLREALGLPRAMPVDVLPPDVRDLVKAEMGPEAHVPLWLWKMLGITNLPEEDAAADASLDPPDALEVLCRLLRARAESLWSMANEMGPKCASWEREWLRRHAPERVEKC